MNDKQLTATLLLFATAFVFWLYNTGRLQNVVGEITNPIIASSGGMNYNGGYNENSPTGSFGSGGGAGDFGGGGFGANSPAPIPSKSLPGLPGLTPKFMLKPAKPVIKLDNKGRIMRDEKGNPIFTVSSNGGAVNSTGLEYVPTLNAIVTSGNGVINFGARSIGTLASGLEGLLS